MNERDLNRLLRRNAEAVSHPSRGADLADTVLSRLPRVRFVIPGSQPGHRILVMAAILGLATAAGISLHRQRRAEAPPQPPPFTLFQPGAVEPLPASPVP